MDCDKLPLRYSGFTIDEVKSTLSRYPLVDLVREAKKDNLKAQQAILVKIDLGICEFEGMPSFDRLERLVEFWDLSKDTTSGLRDVHIAHSVIEIACGSKWYGLVSSPLPEGVCVYALQLILAKDEDRKYFIKLLKDSLA